MTRTDQRTSSQLRQAFEGSAASRGRRLALGLLALLLATTIWIPSVHFLFRPSPNAIPLQARAVANHQLELWEDPALRTQAIQRMRASNAEWDFMGRTYLVLALANMALDEPSQQTRYLKVIDRIIDETLRLEQEKGQLFFLMGYARNRSFGNKHKRSVFVDGEIALILGARQLVSDRPGYRKKLARRVDIIAAQMAESPLLLAESYPDECWMFCNSAALAAIKISDTLDGRSHQALFDGWLAIAKKRLVDPKTGLLISSFTLAGDHLDGPEGSSIFMAAHCLQLIDPVFADDQYRRAKKELAGTICGFSFAREWPLSAKGRVDIDSGPTVPIVGANAGASGLAFLGASAFGDDDYLYGLLTALEFAGFPSETDGQLRYQAGNQVGDAVLLYALVQGPLWRKVLGK